MTIKAFKFHAHSVSPRYFSDLTGQLNPLLDKIKTEGSKSEKDGAKAYADAYAKASKAIKDLVKKLNSQELGYAWKGLTLTSAADKYVDDVANSVTCTWDAAAGKYMKNKASEGDTAKSKLQARLTEFDKAIETKGGTPVKKDE